MASEAGHTAMTSNFCMRCEGGHTGTMKKNICMASEGGQCWHDEKHLYAKRMWSCWHDEEHLYGKRWWSCWRDETVIVWRARQVTLGRGESF